jgi:uncharacterized membrane protein
MKKNLFSGLIILLPIAITIMFIVFIVNLLTAPFIGHVENILSFFSYAYSVDLFYHHTAILLISRILILVFLFFFVWLLGFLANKLFFHWLLKATHNTLLRIPLINSIYRICRDIIGAILSEKEKFFSRVVIVPFPSIDSRSLGLVTGKAPPAVQKKYNEIAPQETLKTVFVPTSPHPLSGFLVIAHESDLCTVDITIEDFFKFLISCGIFTPETKETTPSL